MFAKVNGSEVVNVHDVGFIKVHDIAPEVGSHEFMATFFNGQGKAIAKSYHFEKEADCWDFVRQVISDGSRRDMLAFAALDIKQPAV